MSSWEDDEVNTQCLSISLDRVEPWTNSPGGSDSWGGGGAGFTAFNLLIVVVVNLIQPEKNGIFKVSPGVGTIGEGVSSSLNQPLILSFSCEHHVINIGSAEQESAISVGFKNNEIRDIVSPWET